VLFKSKDEATGKSLVNQYLILDELGRGQHGKVRLARDVNDGSYWVRCHPPPSAAVCAGSCLPAPWLGLTTFVHPIPSLLARCLLTPTGHQDHQPQGKEEALGVLVVGPRPARVGPGPEGEQVRPRAPP
jgi:hypothetical protein